MKNSLLLYHIIGIFVVYCGIITRLYGQNYDLAFQQLTTDDGLSNNFVTSVIQDNNGFIWIGTQEGLNRYDGTSFKVYKINPQNKYHLKNNVITCLSESEGSIWIGTGEGLAKLNIAKDTIADVPFLGSKRINYIYTDPKEEKVFVATDKGVFALLDGEWKPIHYNLPSENNYIFVTVKEINNQKKLLVINYDIAEHSFNLYQLDSSSLQWKPILTTAHHIKYISTQGKIWTSHKPEQHLLDTKTKLYDNNYEIDSVLFIQTRDHHPIQIATAFLSSNKKYIWWTDIGGVAKVNRESKKIVSWYGWETFADRIDQFSVSVLFKDRYETFWLGTSGKGIFIFAKYTLNNFRTYKYKKGVVGSLSNPSVRSIYQDKENTVWLGNYNREGYTDIYLGDSLKTTLIYKHIPLSIEPDKIEENSIWFGNSKGIVKIDRIKRKIIDIYPTKKIVTNLLPVSKDSIWILMGYDLVLFNPIKRTFYSTTIQKVSYFYIDKSNTFWIGTLNRGIGILDTRTYEVKYFSHKEDDSTSISNNHIKSIYEDTRGNFWIATTRGLNLMNREKQTFQRYLEKDGLPNEMIYSVLEDEEQNLWMSTNKGISKFNPTTKEFVNFDKQDGLQDNEYNTNSFFKSHTGELFFGGIEGVNAFYGKDMKKNTLVPPLRLLTIEQNGKTLPFSKEDGIIMLHLSLEEAKRLTFKVAALSYYQSNKNQYAYKLDSEQDLWVNLGSTNEFTLTNIAAGQHTLYIKGSNNHGVWNEDGIKICLFITPPFWQTLWFQALILVAILIAFIIFYKIRSSQAKKRAEYLTLQVEERTSEIAQQTEELKVANDKLVELAVFKENVINMIIHDLKNPLGTILYASKNNNTVQRASQRMMNLITTLLDAQKIHRPTFELNLEAITINKLLQESLDEIKLFLTERDIELVQEYKHNFLLHIDYELIRRTLVNLLINAIKFSSSNSKIKIQAGVEAKGWLQITITDYGTGIHASDHEKIFSLFNNDTTHSNTTNIPSTGLGLSFCKMAVEAHGGKIWVTSTPNVITTFYFTVPFLGENSAISSLVDTTLTENEQQQIEALKSSLRVLKVYQISQIRNALSQVESASKTVNDWKKEVEKVAYLCDEDQYQKLIDG